jgi:hypothetical protein
MGLPKPAFCSTAAVNKLIMTWEDSRAFRGPRHPARSQDSSRGKKRINRILPRVLDVFERYASKGQYNRY